MFSRYTPSSIRAGYQIFKPWATL